MAAGGLSINQKKKPKNDVGGNAAAAVRSAQGAFHRGTHRRKVTAAGFVTRGPQPVCPLAQLTRRGLPEPSRRGGAGARELHGLPCCDSLVLTMRGIHPSVGKSSPVRTGGCRLGATPSGGALVSLPGTPAARAAPGGRAARPVRMAHSGPPRASLGRHRAPCMGPQAAEMLPAGLVRVTVGTAAGAGDKVHPQARGATGTGNASLTPLQHPFFPAQGKRV